MRTQAYAPAPAKTFAAAYAANMPSASNNSMPTSASGMYSTRMRETLMATPGIGLPRPLKDAFANIGGFLCTNDAELATRVRWWQSWGAKKKYYHEIKGGNSRLDGLQAAVLNVKLKYIDDWNADRRMLADRYTELIRALNIPDVQVPTVPKGSTSVWHLYVVRTTKRDELLAYLNKNGIGAGDAQQAV